MCFTLKIDFHLFNTISKDKSNKIMCEFIIALIQIAIIVLIVILQGLVFQICWNASVPIVFEYQQIPSISFTTSLCLIAVVQILFPAFEHYSAVTKVYNSRTLRTTQDSESTV
eukprot:Pompholyxophrys_sp_v1_NODE_2_length_20472_cov_5.132586.p17 type:complete len:113 gc:universal NODE_2_length_20472_cov_5.132586:16869-16531(-)